MYNFYHGHLKQKYGPRCELLYTDTDSLLLEIKTEDVYKDMVWGLSEYYDTSDYPKDHLLHRQENTRTRQDEGRVHQTVHRGGCVPAGQDVLNTCR